MKLESGMMKVVLIACTTLGLGASAWADDMPFTVKQTVKYSATEAATAEGAVKLYGSLRAAASRVCRSEGVPFMVSTAATELCRSAALSRAVEDVNITALTAVHMQDARYKPKAGIVTLARR